MNKWIILIIILIIIFFLFNNKESFENTGKKIAFCFLIYDKINHEELWNNWLKNIDKNKYNIYIHYKENKLLKHFNNKKIKENIKTSWGDISVVLAQNLLLKEALKDPNNQNFIFVTGSCIPQNI